MPRARLEEAIVHSLKIDYRDCKAATFNQRLAATIIDFMFFSTFLAIYQQVFGAALSVTPNLNSTIGVVLTELSKYSEVVMIITYFLMPQFLSGQTLGKKILRIKIVTTEYHPDVPLFLLTVRLILVFFFAIPPLSLLFWYSLRGPQQLAWHDSFTGTRVIEFRF